MIALLVVAILVLLIVIHELGHFIAAKISRVRVEEFGVGYPPRAFTFGRFADTEYTLNWIPFGGFVRLFGDEGENQHGRGSYVDASRWKQATILFAGVMMNAAAAWGLFALAFHIGVPQRVTVAEPGEKTRLIVSEVVPGSPAAIAGITLGDEILGMNDDAGAKIASTTPQMVVNFVKTRGGRALTVNYMHEGSLHEASIRPANAVIPDAAGRPALGIGLALVANKSLPWRGAFSAANRETLSAFGTVWGDLSSIVRGAFVGAPNLSGVVGPIGIVSYVGDAAQNGVGAVLILAALISVNLAIINLIPIPALDGGRLLILVVESALRRSLPRLAIQLSNALGIALIVLLMVTVTYNDIARLLV